MLESKKRFEIRSNKTCFLHFTNMLWTRFYALNSTASKLSLLRNCYKLATVSPRCSLSQFLQNCLKLTPLLWNHLEMLSSRRNALIVARLRSYATTRSLQLLGEKYEHRI